MTRLTEGDVRGLLAELREFEDGLRGLTGLDLVGLGRRATGTAAARPERLASIHVAVVPISTGLGFIPGFAECVAVIVARLGCPVAVTSQPDVRGLQEAADSGAEVLFTADDDRFVALNIHTGACVDDDPATADGYAHALDAACGGVSGREVLLLGLGPVGRAAAGCLSGLGAAVLAAEPDAARVAAATAAGLPFTRVTLDEGLGRCELVFDATPAADLVDAGWVRPTCFAAVPGVPSAFTAAAQAALGARHIHEPLAVGVAVMTLRALSSR